MAKVILVALILLAGYLWLRKGNAKALLSESEARAILGLKADAGREDVKAAHRRLLNAVHPDRGGSADLTRRINAARDVLLRK